MKKKKKLTQYTSSTPTIDIKIKSYSKKEAQFLANILVKNQYNLISEHYTI